ncbi:MAG: SPFH domain-containing protein [Alistipes sp.]|nr:SPFH domain-containing protein [Alistipes sp.]
MAIRYKKFEQTEYVMKIKKGKIVQQGPGLAFFYNTMTTSLMVFPATAFDTPFAYDDIITSDFQKITVQGDISYTITDYQKAAKMVDFSYKNNRKEDDLTRAVAAQKMSKRMINLIKTYTAKYISAKNIKEIIKSADELAEFLKTSLKKDETVQELGLQMIAVSVLAILPQPDTRRALEAATREEILKQQDDAVYKRRNSAIEQERIIKENELNTEIKIAEKEKKNRKKRWKQNA